MECWCSQTLNSASLEILPAQLSTVQTAYFQAGASLIAVSHMIVIIILIKIILTFLHCMTVFFAPCNQYTRANPRFLGKGWLSDELMHLAL